MLLALLEGAYVLTPLPTNKARIRQERRSLEEQNQNRFQSCLLFFLVLCFFLSHTYRKRLKTFELAKSPSKKKSELQCCNHAKCHSNTSCSAAATLATTSQCHSVAALQPRELQRHNVVNHAQRRSHISCSATTL